MTSRLTTVFPRLFGAACSLAIMLGAVALPAAAQSPGAGRAQLSTGANCTYSAITTYPDGGVTVTCSGASTTIATITLGTPGAISTTGGSASLPVTCSGACSGLVVGLSVAYTNVSVTPSLSFDVATTQNATVTGTSPVAAGTAMVNLLVTSSGTATSTSPSGTTPITKGVPITDPASPGTLAIVQNSPGSIPEGASALTVTVARMGAGVNAPATAVPYNCAITPTGYAPTISPANGSTLSWPAGDSSAKSFQITPITLPSTTNGSISCVLGAATGGAVVDPTPYNLTVTKPTTGVCSTSATRTIDATASGTIFYATAGNGESSAIKFKPTRAPFAQLQIQLTMPATATAKPAPEGYTVTSNISECPGDFTLSSGSGMCGRTSGRNSSVINTSTVDPSKCLLDPAKTYYYNVRFTDSAGNNTCKYGGTAACATGVNLTYQ